MNSSKALRRCSACGFGITHAVEFCPECGARQGTRQPGWRNKIFGDGPDRPATCHREIELRAREILERVTLDITRFERQRDTLRKRIDDARAASRDGIALDESLGLVQSAIAARRRVEVQARIALAEVQIERLRNAIELYEQGQDIDGPGPSEIDWRHAARTDRLPTPAGAASVPLFAHAPGGRWLATSSKDGGLQVWDMSRSAAEIRLGERATGWTALAFTPDGRLLLTGSAEGTIRAWDTSRWPAHERIGQHEQGVRALVAAPDGSWIASAGKDGVIRFWDVSKREQSFALRGHEAAIVSLAVTANGAWMASGSWDGVLKLWNLRRRVEQGSIAGHAGGVLALAFHPDGTRLVSGGWDRTVRIWNFRDGQASRELGAHDLGVLSLAFSRDGRWLASGGGDRAIKIWGAPSFDEEVTLRGGNEPVLGLAFAPDGQALHSSGGNEGIHVWAPVLPPLFIYEAIAGIARLASRRDGMQTAPGPTVVMRAHQLMGRALRAALLRLASLATARGASAVDSPPEVRDLEDAMDRLLDRLRGLDVEPSLREPLEHDLREAAAVRSELAGHAALAGAGRLMQEAEEQLADLAAADDTSCEQRLERLRQCEQRAARWQAWLPSGLDASDASPTQRATIALRGLAEQLPSLQDVVLARQATAIVASVAPIADQQPLASLRRLHETLRTAVAASEAIATGSARTEAASIVALMRGPANLVDILAGLEERYRDVTSELEAVMEVDDLLRGKP